MTPETLRTWTEALSEAVDRLTGIRLDEHAGSWRAEGEALLLEGESGVVLRLDLSEDWGPEDASEVLPPDDDLRRTLTEARLALIEARLGPLLREKLASVLGEEDWDLEFQDGGHWPSMHGMVEAEYVRDYGDLVAEVSLMEEHPAASGDLDEDRFSMRLDAYQAPFHDEGDLEELLEKLRGRLPA